MVTDHHDRLRMSVCASRSTFFRRNGAPLVLSINGSLTSRDTQLSVSTYDRASAPYPGRDTARWQTFVLQKNALTKRTQNRCAGKLSKTAWAVQKQRYVRQFLFTQASLRNPNEAIFTAKTESNRKRLSRASVIGWVALNVDVC